MFEFMHKYRMPILAVMFLGLIGFGAWGAVQSMFGGPENVLQGSFSIPGLDERVEVYTEDTNKLRNFLGGDESRWKSLAQSWGVQEEDPDLFLWDFMVLAHAAKAAGIAPTDSAVRRWLEQRFGEIPEDNWKRFHEDFIDHQRDIMAISQFRSQYITQDPGGVTYAELLEEYKRQYSTVKAKVIVFDKKEPEDYACDLSKEEDRKKLEEWFNRNKWVASRNKMEESADLEVAYVRLKDQSVEDFKTLFEKTFAAATKDMVVKPEELQARYNASKYVYRQLVPTAVPEPDKPDPAFAALVENGHLEREIKVARLAKNLYDEANADAAKFEAAATAAGFKFAKLSEVTRDDLVEQPDFGSLRLSSLVWESGVNKLPKDGADPQDGDYKLGSLFVDADQPSGGLEANVFDDPGQMIGQLRMVAHHPERVPEFKEITVKVKEEWQTQESTNELNQAPAKFQEAVEEWILALPELKEKVDAAKEKREKDVTAELERQKLDRANAEHKDRIEGVEKRHHRFMKVSLAEDMKPHYQKGFDAVSTEKGYEAFDFGPVSKSGGVTPQYPEGLSREERLNRMLRTLAILNSLSNSEVGQMSGQPNGTAGLALSMILTEKQAPDAAELLMYPDRVRQIAAGRRVLPDRAWNYEIFKHASFFDVKAPKVDEYIKARRDSLAKKARQKAERERRRRADQMRRAEEARKKAEAEAKKNAPTIDPGKEDVDTETPKPKPDPDKTPTPDKKPGGN